TEAFFGGKVSDGMKAHVEKRLPRAIDAFKQMTQFSPYVLGESFGLADIAAWVHLPVIGMATKAVFGRDFLLDAGIDWKTHAKKVGERPAALRVAAERKAYIDATSVARS
ncbi:glutathione S-transferase, partial [Burkholderia contaminans]